MLDRQLALHLEAKDELAANLLNLDGSDRFRHRTGEPSGAGLADQPVPLAGRLPMIMDLLDQRQGSVRQYPAAAYRPRLVRLLHHHFDEAEHLGPAFEETERFENPFCLRRAGRNSERDEQGRDGQPQAGLAYAGQIHGRITRVSRKVFRRHPATA